MSFYSLFRVNSLWKRCYFFWGIFGKRGVSFCTYSFIGCPSRHPNAQIFWRKSWAIALWGWLKTIQNCWEKKIAVDTGEKLSHYWLFTKCVVQQRTTKWLPVWPPGDSFCVDPTHFFLCLWVFSHWEGLEINWSIFVDEILPLPIDSADTPQRPQVEEK